MDYTQVRPKSRADIASEKREIGDLNQRKLKTFLALRPIFLRQYKAEMIVKAQKRKHIKIMVKFFIVFLQMSRSCKKL